MEAWPFHIYRRHRRDCKPGQAEDSLSSEFDERRKGWKRCDCPITASGTLAKRYCRQSTGQWEWETARDVVAHWEANQSWGAVAPLPAPESTSKPPRVTVAEASQAFRDKIISRGLAPDIIHKNETFLRQLRAFADKKGFLYIDQFTITDMDAFYAGWKDGKGHGEENSISFRPSLNSAFAATG
jgi:hypothetical protein